MPSKLTYNNLGNLEIKVSSLCFGTLTVSPLQCGYSVKAASSLFFHAIDRGINFFDTANLYSTYPPLKEAVKYKNDIVIATKDYCYDAKTAEKSLDAALKGIGRDYVDIFLLHEQESRHTIRGHWEAIEYLIRRREKGDIRAIGLSTHFAAAVEDSINIDEIQVIHPIYNMKGLGIVDGKAERMKKAMEASAAKGKGIYLMKALGGGHLASQPIKAFKHVFELEGVSSVAVGMKNRDEVDYNVSVFSGLKPSDDVEKRIGRQERKLHIHDWCTGCGECVKACDKRALSVTDGKARVDAGKCVLCGYCAARCKDFCIKVI